MEHVTIYREKGRYAGWPANYGMWSWGNEIVLRDDAGSHDLGYPRSIQRPDGTIVTAYYFNDQRNGEGYIAATLWKP